MRTKNDIKVREVSTDYLISKGDVKINVTKVSGSDHLIIHTHNGDSEFCFHLSQASRVKTIGELLIKASTL